MEGEALYQGLLSNGRKRKTETEARVREGSTESSGGKGMREGGREGKESRTIK